MCRSERDGTQRFKQKEGVMAGNLETMLNQAQVHIGFIQTDMMTVIIVLIFFCAILGGLDLIIPLLGDTFARWREGRRLDDEYEGWIAGSGAHYSKPANVINPPVADTKISNDEWESDNPKMW